MRRRRSRTRAARSFRVEYVYPKLSQIPPEALTGPQSCRRLGHKWPFIGVVRGPDVCARCGCVRRWVPVQDKRGAFR